MPSFICKTCDRLLEEDKFPSNYRRCEDCRPGPDYNSEKFKRWHAKNKHLRCYKCNNYHKVKPHQETR